MAPGVEFGDLNWLAIGVMVVVNMALGFLWYATFTPTGKIWMKAHNMDPTTTKPTSGQMAKGLILTLIGAFLVLFVLNHTVIAYGDAYNLDEAGYELTIADGLMGGFFTWLGFFVPVLWSAVAWEGKPWSLFFVNAGYYLVILLLAGLLFIVLPGGKY